MCPQKNGSRIRYGDNGHHACVVAHEAMLEFDGNVLKLSANADRTFCYPMTIGCRHCAKGHASSGLRGYGTGRFPALAGAGSGAGYIGPHQAGQAASVPFSIKQPPTSPLAETRCVAGKRGNVRLAAGVQTRPRHVRRPGVSPSPGGGQPSLPPSRLHRWKRICSRCSCLFEEDRLDTCRQLTAGVRCVYACRG
jgi:hypothetical protein